MQRNTIYRQVYRRRNVVADFILDAFIASSSWFRLVIEVFIRKNMGQRYFKLSSAITVAVLLFFYPIIAEKIPGLIWMRPFGDYHRPSAIGMYWSWYLFTAVYIVCGYKRWREQKSNPSVFNGGRCTTYAGDVNEHFFKLHPFGRRLTLRQVECFVEPAIFFCVGYLLNLLGQKIGGLFMVSSVFYCLSYIGLYRKGDNYLMDILDELIYATQLSGVVMSDSPNNAWGVRVHGAKPADKAGRQRLAEALQDQEQNTFFVS